MTLLNIQFFLSCVLTALCVGSFVLGIWSPIAVVCLGISWGCTYIVYKLERG